MRDPVEFEITELPCDQRTYASRMLAEMNLAAQMAPQLPRVPVRRVRSDAARIKTFLRTNTMPSASYLE